MERPYFTREEWMDSEQYDYSHARSDNERRRMLLRFGVDPAHQAEADRLFPKYAEYEQRRKENEQHPVKSRVRRACLRFKNFFLKLEKKLALPVRIAEMFLAIYGVFEAVYHIVRFLVSIFR